MSELHDIRPIAMYLPQFHPIPENNAWWGEGFTEWTNVRKSQPRFPGHYQPHVPGQLGYYDLRDPAARAAQADLARAYGIHGFCYYHYWFNGKRLLETPFNEVLRTGEPDFPFCLCWANENWTRRWDGSEKEILMGQHYSDEDSLAFINDLIPDFRDERYIRVNGKPLFLVYRTGLLPDPKRTAEIWRNAVHQAGLGDIYLVRVENHLDGGTEVVPAEIGFDAAMEFAPYWGRMGARVKNLAEIGLEDHDLDEEVDVYDYLRCMRNMIARRKPAYPLFRGVFPSWDNSARRRNKPTIFANSSPSAYAVWLAYMLRYTRENFTGDERLLFINAWNEWGEGCHLEPDVRHGLQYLEQTRLALASADADNDSGRILSALFAGLEVNNEQLFRMFHETIQGRDDLIWHLLGSDSQTYELRSQLAKKQELIDSLYASLSWRITGPLRALHKLLTNSGK